MWTFSITDPGEGYYVEAAREMVESDEYTVPHLNYQIYFSKPILTFWLIAFPYSIFGPSEFSARISFSVISTILVFAAYALGKSLSGVRAGIYAGLIAATSPLIVTMTRLSPIDIAFACFLNLATFALLQVIFAARKRWWPLIWIGLGLSVLTKGPAGIVLFFLGTVFFLAVRRPCWAEFRRWFHAIEPGWGALIFYAIVIPWYLAVDFKTKGLFLLVFFLYENMARFAGHTNLGHAPIWFFLPVLAYGLAPWTVYLPAALMRALRYVRMDRTGITEAAGSGGTAVNGGRSDSAAATAADTVASVEAVGTRAADWRRGQAELFIACWCIAVFCFFSLSKTKLDTYILPLIAPLAVLVALTLDEWVRRWEEEGKRSQWLYAASWLFAVIGVLLLAGGVGAAALAKQLTFTIRLLLPPVTLVFCLGAITQLKELRRGRAERSVYLLLGSVALGFSFLTVPIFQWACISRYDDLKTIGTHVRNIDADLAIFDTFKPALMFYANKPVDSFFHPQQLEPVRAGDDLPRPQYVVVSDRALARLAARPGLNLRLFEKVGQWSVYEAVGAKLRKNYTLESVFSTPGELERIVSGKGEWGPLTVPYAGGDPVWWLKK